MKLAPSALVAAISLLAGSCRPATAQEGSPPMPFSDPTITFKVETVVEGVEVPWSIAWTTPDRMLFTERPGRVRQFVDGVLNPAPLYTVPNVIARGGEIGLMGLCVHPDHAKNKFVYLAFGHADTSGPEPLREIRVQRFIDDGTALSPDKVIINVQPANSNHAGCRIEFGPDAKLYISTGEGFERDLAQNLGELGGKVLRVNDDGSIPGDNPFVGEDHKAKGHRAEIWSWGHRNPQGLTWNEAGQLYSTEHGPSGEGGTGRGGDEFNHVEKGKNYGWPTIHHSQVKDGLVSPLIEWTPATAPASAAAYNADKFPELRGNILVGMLGGLSRAQNRPGLVRIILENGKPVRQERLVTGVGRVRAVAVGPDGLVYLSTSNRDGRGGQPPAKDDRILRLIPSN